MDTNTLWTVYIKPAGTTEWKRQCSHTTFDGVFQCVRDLHHKHVKNGYELKVEREEETRPAN